jgi:hypothetical protein
MTYVIPPAPVDPKPLMVDCTDRPDLQEIIEASVRGGRKDPRGGWKGGRYLVYADSLKDWRGEKREIDP